LIHIDGLSAFIDSHPILAIGSAVILLNAFGVVFGLKNRSNHCRRIGR
jgi:hypothetical protein